MKKNYYLIIIFATIILGISQTVQAQPSENFTKLFESKFTRMYPMTLNWQQQALMGTNATTDTATTQDVSVKYESPTTILIGGGLITEDHFFNSNVWKAMDMLKNQYGFKLQQVMTSGVGSEGNPTDVYILMTK